MGSRYFISPLGDFVFPWVNKADTKFNADGLYHADLDVPLDVARPTMDKIEAAAQASLDRHLDTMTAGQKKQWSLLLPFEELVDDETGEPTGIVRFSFKQNAKIKTKDGSVKEVSIEVRDAANEIVETPVWGGDSGKVMFTMRDIVVSSTKKAGVRLDFAKVQLIKKAKSGMSDAGFEEVEGGYVAGGRDYDSASNESFDNEEGNY